MYCTDFLQLTKITFQKHYTTIDMTINKKLLTAMNYCFNLLQT